MDNNRQPAGMQFDRSRTKLSSRFMAGRGQVLLEAINKPLQAKEFAKRRKLQEMLFKGEIKLDQSNVPEDLLPLNLASRNINSKVNGDTKYPILPKDSLPSPVQPQQNSVAFPSLPSSDGRSDNSSNKVSSDSSKQTSNENPQSNWDNQDKCFTSKDLDNKNVSKPLRKPDKTRKKQLESEKMSDSESVTEQDQGLGAIKSPVVQPKVSNPWLDWEDDVIVPGNLAEEDLHDIAKVEDNDDIHDVVVNQYIDSLQTTKQSSNKIETSKSRKLTPQRVQQFSKLKSTSNADCMRMLPGTIPNPPKSDDRWGGTELNGSARGWGDPLNKARNEYDDGSSMWSAGGSQYGGRGWSSAS